MLKVRIMPTLLYKSPTLVKGIGFDSWRRVGSVMQAVKIYNMREVDELVFLDITASNEKRRPDFELIDDIADECFMPLTVGGGVKTIEDFRDLLKVGADKVAINTAAIEDPDLIRKASDKFGSQCVIVSIDYKKNKDGNLEIFTYSGSKPTGINPVEFAQKAENLGAGELLITSIERDGTMNGYDIETIKMISENIEIPIIASGGAGNYDDFYKVITDAKVQALAAASIFHFTEQTPKEAREFLRNRDVLVRS